MEKYTKLVGWLIPWKTAYGLWSFEGPESDKPISPALWLAIQSSSLQTMAMIFQQETADTKDWKSFPM